MLVGECGVVCEEVLHCELKGVDVQVGKWKRWAEEQDQELHEHLSLVLSLGCRCREQADDVNQVGLFDAEVERTLFACFNCE